MSPSMESILIGAVSLLLARQLSAWHYQFLQLLPKWMRGGSPGPEAARLPIRVVGVLFIVYGVLGLLRVI